MSHLFRLGAALVLGLALLLTATAGSAFAVSHRPTEPVAPAGAIAYLHPQPNGTTDFHLIQPDGSGDHIFATLPISAANFMPELAWKPDATELAFTSNHEELTSFWHSDIYAMRPDGSGLRRITNGPDQSALASYPKGSVTVNVSVSSGGPYLVYFDGAPHPLTAIAGTTSLTFDDVAIFPGPRLQRAVGMFGFNRYFTAGVGAVLQPGKTVQANGTLELGGEGTSGLGAGTPTWRSDGAKLAFRFLDCCFNVISANPAEEDNGAALLSPAVSFAGLIDYNPLPAKAAQFLYTTSDVFNGYTIGLTSEDQGEGQALVNTGSNLRTIRDLKWLPDGSGFVFSEDEMDADGIYAVAANLYEYDFAGGNATAITHFTDQFASRFSIAPDGQQIVFEHGTTGAVADSLWLVNRDGSNPHVFVAGPNVGRPAWSRVNPVVQPPPQTGSRLLLPFLMK